MSRTRFKGKVIRLTRRGRARTADDQRQAKIEADTEAAVAALLETQAPEHRAAILRAAHRVVARQLAKIDGAETTASFLAVEAGRLWPQLRSAPVAEGEAVFAALVKRAGGGRG